MLVMPLRITHVDTKVLVLLVQAMPTSLHTACSIPLNPSTGRQAPAKKPCNNEVISVGVCGDAIRSSDSPTSKVRCLISAGAKTGLCIYR